VSLHPEEVVVHSPADFLALLLALATVHALVPVHDAKLLTRVYGVLLGAESAPKDSDWASVTDCSSLLIGEFLELSHIEIDDGVRSKDARGHRRPLCVLLSDAKNRHRNDVKLLSSSKFDYYDSFLFVLSIISICCVGKVNWLHIVDLDRFVDSYGLQVFGRHELVHLTGILVMVEPHIELKCDATFVAMVLAVAFFVDDKTMR
jgi:hypothetical protein